MNSSIENSMNGDEIAVIGMSGRFPCAKNIDEFWSLLKSGKEGISEFTLEELKQQGVAEELLNNPNYIKRNGYLSDKNMFDALLFDYSSSEASLLNPQVAVFHECVMEALENAGYCSENYANPIGLYAGATESFEWLSKVGREFESPAEAYKVGILANSQFLATRIAYKFNLRGPAFGVQTACSTSLVAVYLACQGLNAGECDIALAGGVSIHPGGKSGYLFQEGMIASSDGYCRPFDAKATGTLGGEGAGVLVLKRLEDAFCDRDNILVLIKGAAINNDGNQKVGYTAPSVKGQAEVIKAALQLAGVPPQSISYIEAHGTATKLGDPIEIKALTKAFGEVKSGNCKIGSVKSNIGHLDAAAGVAGLIKTILALKYKQLPPSLHFNEPNPHIDLANSPFQVNTALCDWVNENGPLRAGVSSFGIGGTNAHIVLEEARFQLETSKSRKAQMVYLSANSKEALEEIEKNLVQYVVNNPNTPLSDLCYTLQVGRKPLPYRKAWTITDLNELTLIHEGEEWADSFSGKVFPGEDKICFMFPGQGSQYLNMGKDLYNNEKVFRDTMDCCFGIARKLAGTDFKALLFPDQVSDEAGAKINQAAISQPLLFIFEYSLAKLLITWGCRPDVMIGHSVGEYVAACLSGVFSLEDALLLVTRRGEIIQNYPSGSMLCILASETTIRVLLDEQGLNSQLCITAINSPDQLVVSGDDEAFIEFRKLLDKHGLQNTLLHNSYVFQSQYIKEIFKDYEGLVKTISLSPPTIPFISNISGNLITVEQAASPAYWSQHLWQCVQFSQGVKTICDQNNPLLLEVGPGNILGTYVQQNSVKGNPWPYVSTVPGANLDNNKPGEGQRFLMSGLCQLFVNGVTLNWEKFYKEEARKRIPLPTYPFERKSYWIADNNHSLTMAEESTKAIVRQPIDRWYSVPVWLPTSSASSFKPDETDSWLIFMDDCGIGKNLVDQVSKLGKEAITVVTGNKYQAKQGSTFEINPSAAPQYTRLIMELEESNRLPSVIIHLWGISAVNGNNLNRHSSGEANEQLKIMGFYSQIYLAQALGQLNDPKQITIKICANATQKISVIDQVIPEKSINIAPSRVISSEYSFLKCQYTDIVLEEEPHSLPYYEGEALVDDLLGNHVEEKLIGYRSGMRWMQEYRDIALPPVDSPETTLLRKKGCYLITGGLGGMGLIFAKYLAKFTQSTLILLTRSNFIEKDRWADWLYTHGPDDITSQKILSLQEIESFGATCMILTLDVADAEKSKTTIQLLVAEVGHINGVFHTAGLPGDGIIQTKTDSEIKQVLAPKIEGTLNLNKYLPSKELDFVVLFSSLTALSGGVGQVDYCAANLFLDTFAQDNNQHKTTRYLSINWPAWKETGMAFRMNLAQAFQAIHNEELEKFGICPDEGIEAFFRALAYKALSQVAISPYSISTMLEHSREINHHKDQNNTIITTTHVRPELCTEYFEPETELEKQLVQIWSEVLGLDKIGIEDNFFDLGGDSLVMLSIQKQINYRIEKKLTIATLFQYPSIRTLCHFLNHGVENSQNRDGVLNKSKQRLLNLRKAANS